jgi:hypothetical protein
MKMGPYSDHLTGPKLPETIVGNEWQASLQASTGATSPAFSSI